MTLKVHHLRPAPGAHTAKTRVGRGEGSKGKTAGRGTKGTGARGNTSARFEGGQTPLHMRLPKLSGFKNNNKVVFQVVNLDRIAALFPQGGSIDPDTPGRRRRRPPRPAGQGARHRRPRRREGRRPRARLLRVRRREDRRGRGQHHPHLKSKDPPAHGTLARAPQGAVCCPARAGPRGLVANLTRPIRGGHVLQAFAAAFRTPDLRRKLLFSLAMIAIYRLGASVPGPGVSVQAINSCLEQAQASDQRDIYSLVNLFSGGALLRLSVFALGIMPYITASIIVQLLVVVIPRFEQLKKEGQSGQAEADPVHPLPHDRAGDPAEHRHHRPGPQRPAVPELQRVDHPVGLRLDDGRPGHRPHRRHRADHVAGRAAHREGDRQRHVRADLHLDRRAHPRRGRLDPADPRRRSSSPSSAPSRS